MAKLGRRRNIVGKGRRRSPISPAEVERPDRRKDILRSAEILFAERGYAAVSVRDIAAMAKVPIALIGYYFGRKQDLFGTIFEHRQGYITERIDRMEGVDCSSGNPGNVEDLVRAWAEPVIGLRSGGAGEIFSLLVARTAWDPGPEANAVIERFYDPLARLFVDKMAVALPHCSRKQILWGYEYALGALLMYVADKRVVRLSDGSEAAGDPQQCEEFIRFIGAGFRVLGSRREIGSAERRVQTHG
jgi:AcrR family transcriptional regulator